MNRLLNNTNAHANHLTHKHQSLEQTVALLQQDVKALHQTLAGLIDQINGKKPLTQRQNSMTKK